MRKKMLSMNIGIISHLRSPQLLAAAILADPEVRILPIPFDRSEGAIQGDPEDLELS